MTWCSHRKGVNEGLCRGGSAGCYQSRCAAAASPPLSPPFTPPPAFPFCASGTGRGETGKHCRGGGWVGGWEGERGVDGACGIWWGRLQIGAATPAVIADRCALYACASASCPSYITSSAAEDGRKQDPGPPSKWDEGIEGQEVPPWCCPSGTWLPVGKSRE